MVVVQVGPLFESSGVDSYVQSVAEVSTVSFPVHVGTKIHMLSKRFIREVASHTEM